MERRIKMKFTRVALIGAGAVGSYIIWGLSTKKDIDFSVIADENRKERLEKEGIVINDVKCHPNVLSPEEAKGADLIFVATKYSGLADAADMVKTAADEHTTVISLMNGVDSEEVIASRIGMDSVIPALIKIASRRVGNTIHFNPDSTMGIVIGESPEGKARWGNERLDAFGELLSGTGIRYRTTDVILSEIWAKFRLNVTKNLPQAAVGCGIGAYDDSAHVRFIMEKLGQEVDAIAAARGIDISLAASGTSSALNVPKTTRYSTLQDLDAKRHTEIDMFSGAIVSMGRTLGIPTPYNEMMYHMIKAIEEKNDGVFDYEDKEF